jgi:hypothetical protein
MYLTYVNSSYQMLNARKSLILAAILSASPLAWGGESETLVVGTIPYTNQWKFEELDSFLYLTYNQQHMAETTLTVNQYTATFTPDSNHPTVDYFIRIARFADAETASIARYFSLWGRYSLGLGVKQGQLASGAFQLSDASSTGYLAHGVMRLGVNLTYEKYKYFWPYLGVQGIFTGYRHTAAIGGAEAQGGAGGYELIGGVHMPILFGRRISVFAEGRYTNLLSNNTPVYSNGFFAAAGLGFSI